MRCRRNQIGTEALRVAGVNLPLSGVVLPDSDDKQRTRYLRRARESIPRPCALHAWRHGAAMP